MFHFTDFKKVTHHVLNSMMGYIALPSILQKIMQVWSNYFPLFLCPPLKKEGHIALHMSVGMSVALNLVQLITQERFAPETSNLVGR